MLGSLSTVAILLWGFAPHIPQLRRAVPAARRVDQLETFWAEGHRLANELVETIEDLPHWLKAQENWYAQVGDWIERHLSKVEAERFRRPDMQSVSFELAQNDQHNHRLMLLSAELPELIRLRDEQQAKLR